MRFVCDSCRAQYMISDDKVGAKGVKVRCKKCSHVILVRKGQDANASAAPAPAPAAQAPSPPPDAGMSSPLEDDSPATQVMMNPLAESVSVAPASNEGSRRAPLETSAPAASAAPASPSGLEGTHPGSTVRADSSFFSNMAEDEIGAAFDSVLGGTSGGGTPAADPFASKDPAERTSLANLPSGDDEDATGMSALGGSPIEDRLSTKVLDAEAVRRLADEAGGVPSEWMGAGAQERAPKDESYEWYVAIDDKQVGPLSSEKVKERWDAGEVGPDTLCWRAGMGDWAAVSEVQELAAHLAPQPRKPVVVPAAAVAPGASALMAEAGTGGFAGTGSPPATALHAEASMAFGGEDPGGWKPSAAAALASLVQEEINALTSPKPKGGAMDPGDLPAAAMAAQSFLNLPPAQFGSPAPGAPAPASPQGLQAHAGAVAPASAVQLPAMMQGHASMHPSGVPMPDPYASMPPGLYNSQPPAYGAYAPIPQTPSPSRNGLYLLVGGGLVAVLALTVLVMWLVMRPAAPVPPVGQAQPLAVAPPQPQPAPAAPPAAAPSASPSSAAEEKEKAEPVAAKAPSTRGADSDTRDAAPAKRADKVVLVQPDPARAPAQAPAPVAPAPSKSASASASAGENVSGSDDEFCREFGCDDDKPKAAARAPKSSASKSAPSVYVPPPPGSANVPETLGQSDIMSVVLANKPAIVQCGAEQKKKEPGMSGRLVMRWTILTSGKATNVTVRSEEFKNTHIASCIGGLIKTWRFPRHRTQGDPVDFPFTF